MEAGYDYLLLRGRLQRRFFNVSGIFVFVFGAMLLATSGAYYGYAAKAHADLDNLNVTLPNTGAKISAGPGSQGSITESLVDHGQEGVSSLSTPVQSEGQSSSQAEAPAVRGTGAGTGGAAAGSPQGSGAPKVTEGGASTDPVEDPLSVRGGLVGQGVAPEGSLQRLPREKPLIAYDRERQSYHTPPVARMKLGVW